MAATQAEKQQNDVNSEKVQPDQHLNVRNSLLQNGTDKSSVRGGCSVVVTKTKNTGSKTLGLDMSQYRQDGGGGGGGEQGLSESEMGPSSESGIYTSAPTSTPEGPTVGDGHGYNFPFGNSRDIHNSGDGGLHTFGPRQTFGGPKQPQQPPGVMSQQRIFSGQTISQPTGPTPTLNQLLQSTNPVTVTRYQNSYGHPEQPYNQGWPPQKPLVSYSTPGVPSAPPASVYRNQSTLSPAYSGGTSSSPGYEGRGGWAGPSVTGQHGPGSPGPPSSSTPASQPSPQPSQPQSHSPGPGLPTSPQHQTQGPSQHQGFPNRPAQPTTPNAHAPDQADLSGGNSNDSSGGAAPGTPNSQGMRPTPSPTGSTGSRSMSPAVGQPNIPMPPRPSSGQSDGSGSTRMSHSPIATQGSTYPPHHMHSYKGHPGIVSQGGQQISIYQPNQQYSQGAYPARPPSNMQYPNPNQGYGPASQAPPNNNLPPQQYTNRSVAPNHMPPNSQFTPYQQSWPAPVASSGNHIPSSGGKGNGPPPPPQANSPSPGPTRPPHYLKQHLQHKMGFANIPPSMPPSPSPPQNYHMGPPPVGHHHSGMGPPPSMGPPNMPPATSPLLTNNHPHDGPMPPPSSTPNSHNQMVSDMMDNGITTIASGNLSTNVTAASVGSVTSVVTTGPDGTPIDEGSQQSTLSNASAASGEDPQCTTPKSRKNDMGHYSHPTTPQSTVPSPAASMNSMHEEYGDLNSPSWPRTPASPVFNSHVPPAETYRSKKTDSLSKLYEMDDSPERRAWLDKLLGFMEDRRSPITTCPTISKNPLDLFRLYVYVKERGGFMEVTKNKTWKDIAGMLGIGASSSAAYTLRKHYTKNLLAYECQFDRGGIDPQPIISQVEASSKKKGGKASSVPSPGSSNSQDSFPAPGSGGASMDGYSQYGYPPGGNPEYNAPQQRPSSQSNAPSPHSGTGGANHLSNATPAGTSPAGGVSDNVNVSNPFDDVSPSPPPRGGPFPSGPHPPYSAGTPPRPQGQGYTGQGGYNQYPGPGPGAPPDQYSSYATTSGYPPPRPVYPPYSGDSAPPPANPNNTQGTSPQGQDPYNRYSIGGGPGAPGAGYTPRPTAYAGAPVGASGPPTPQPPASYSSQQDYYRPEQQQTGSGTGTYAGVVPPTSKNMPPPAPQPRRHPDFAKEPQAYPQYGQQRPQLYPGWPNNSQYRGQYVGSGGPNAGNQQWTQGGRPSGQWDRYPTSQVYQPAPQQGNQQWQPMTPSGVVGPSPSIRSPMVPRGAVGVGVGVGVGKPPFNMQPPQACKGAQPQTAASGTYTQNQIPKREITFPPDSVEATLPVLYRRKRLCRTDLGPVDAWRIIMCLRSGLLSESCYALDVLNVLLYDDSSVAYFGLNQWNGLLDLLLEHFRKSLSDMFDGPFPPEEKPDESDVDLGGVVTPIEIENKTVILSKSENFTLLSRKGYPVKMIDRNEDIFIRDHHKDWDTKGDAVGVNILAEVMTDPWYHSSEHILSTFQAEFGRIPFNRKLDDKKKVTKKKKKKQSDESDDEELQTEPHRTSPTSTAISIPTLTETAPSIVKTCDKTRRTKTLSDVISRIKKDSADEEDTLALEIKGKVKTEVVCETIVNCNEDQQNLDLSTISTSVNGDSNISGLNVRDTARTLKRRRMSDYEDEAYSRDDASLILITESQDCVGKRCVCISNILRSLTFIPGNEAEFARSSSFLALVGKLLLFHHDHPLRTQKTRNYDREEDADFADSCSSLQGENEWWWDFLLQIRENILVSISNIAGQIDLDQYSEDVARPLLDGLLHWAICPSAQGQDPFPSVGPTSLLSPQRLALEALCKLCVTNNNVDLVIATPPFSRLERLCTVLTKHLCRSEDQVLREFSINLLHYLAAADSSMARVVASQQPCVSLLVAFIEQAEMSALGVANQHGISALRDNPDSMGTSLDMLRRAASTLVFLAEHPENRPLLIQQESRLLALVMSQILDQQVALLLSKVLYKISHS